MIFKNCGQNNEIGNAHHFQKLFFGLAILATFLAFPCRAQIARPDQAPPAKWVVPMAFNPRTPLDPPDPATDLRWILKDRQLNAQSNESFNHEIRQIVGAGAIAEGSQIAIDYDPNYQLLTFHWVRVWRGTNSLNRLDPDKIQTVPRATNAGELLFGAEKTALFPLDDIRAGDIIDYAYTVQGENPVLAGYFSGVVQLAAPQPIERSRTRLLWPPNRRLYIKNHKTDIRSSTWRKGAVVAYTWDLTKIPAWQNEPLLPIWYQPMPWVQLSEFQSWSDVNRVALGLLTNAGPVSPELKQKINEWKQLPNPEDRVLAPLRFVQDEIRYAGTEGSPSGYKPANSSTVFARRFGDGKEKNLLLATILRGLDVDAGPILVNTRLRQTVEDFQPSLAAFDHVVTQVNRDGQSYLLDATASYQRGPLAVRSWPNYGYGLVVRPGTTALTAFAPCPVFPRTTVNHYFHLDQLDQPGDLKVVTIAEGPDAEQYRMRFATTSHDEIERASLALQAKYYPDITQTAPLTYNDDEEQNKVEVDEFYRIRKVWTHLPDEAFFHFRVFPENVQTVMTPPAVSARTMPLGAAFPQHQLFHAEVFVPSLSLINPDNQNIENPAFYFQRGVSISGATVILDYEFRTLSDAVLPDAVPVYLQQLDAAADLMIYTIPSY